MKKSMFKKIAVAGLMTDVRIKIEQVKGASLFCITLIGKGECIFNSESMFVLTSILSCSILPTNPLCNKTRRCKL